MGNHLGFITLKYRSLSLICQNILRLNIRYSKLANTGVSSQDLNGLGPIDGVRTIIPIIKLTLSPNCMLSY